MLTLPNLRASAVDLGFAAGWTAIKSVPAPIATRAFRAAADAATARNGAGARQLRRNLRRVLGPSAPESQLDELVGNSLRSYARYWLETFRLPSMDHRAIAARADANMTGAEQLDAAMAAGRGVVLALPHMGNWDVGAVWLIHHGVPFTTVAERLKPESLYDRFVAYRNGIGMEVLPLTRGERPVTDVLAERLRGGGCVALVGDRDLSRSGVEVQFFGEPARMPPGPALLAATTGAPLLPVSMWFTDGSEGPNGPGWGERIGAPIDLTGGRLRDRVQAGTQALADWFAAEIARHPADWHMLQKLWLADLDPARVAARV
ncbi:MAG: phosphatidylinositol mannoside acyltransferase [Actinomycetota bacterium]